jgi:predicted AAA+ superfamily ATPase
MNRWLENLVKDDLKEKIVFITGPRQVGKTTVSKSLFTDFDYLNYDSGENRDILLNKLWNRKAKLIIFDELHKMKKWKSWLKGVYDTEGIKPFLLVTGSARLDTYRKGGDSLAGRYYSYRLHPFTVKELKDQMDAEECLKRLLTVGGFPQPFLKNSIDQARRWQRTHLDVILREDLLDLERVRDIKSIEVMIDLLKKRVGSTISYASLTEDLQVSSHTVKKWLQILENLYVIFPVRTYHKNMARSILKDTKYYFYDTGVIIDNKGARLENTVANALLSELNRIEDTTGKKTSLCFLRNKEKQEIDFLTVIDEKPTHLIEVKWSDGEISPHFAAFQKYLGKIPAHQVVHDLKRIKSTPHVQLISAVDFLSNVELG